MALMIEFFLLGVAGLLTIAAALGAIEQMSRKTRRPKPEFEPMTMTKFSKDVVIVKFGGEK